MFKIEKKSIFDQIQNFLFTILSKNDNKFQEKKINYLNYSSNHLKNNSVLDFNAIDYNKNKDTNNDFILNTKIKMLNRNSSEILKKNEFDF